MRRLRLCLTWAGCCLAKLPGWEQLAQVRFVLPCSIQCLQLIDAAGLLSALDGLYMCISSASGMAHDSSAACCRRL